MKIRINDAAKCGLTPHSAGEEYEAEKVGDTYKLKGALYYVRIDNSMIANKHAELVEEIDYSLAHTPYSGATMTVNPVPAGMRLLESVTLVGGSMSGVVIMVPGVILGDYVALAPGMGTTPHRYQITKYNVALMSFEAVPAP